MDRAGTARAWRALSVVAVVAVCLVLSVVVGDAVLGPAVGPLLAPFAGAGLAAGVLALMARGRDDDHGPRPGTPAAPRSSPPPRRTLARRARRRYSVEGTGAAHAQVWLVVPDGLVAHGGRATASRTTTDLLAAPRRRPRRCRWSTTASCARC